MKRDEQMKKIEEILKVNASDFGKALLIADLIQELLKEESEGVVAEIRGNMDKEIKDFMLGNVAPPIIDGTGRYQEYWNKRDHLAHLQEVSRGLNKYLSKLPEGKDDL